MSKLKKIDDAKKLTLAQDTLIAEKIKNASLSGANAKAPDWFKVTFSK